MEILDVTIPIFLAVIAGYLCMKTGLVDEKTRNFLGKAVYYVAFPALTFRSIVRSDFQKTFKSDLINMIAQNFLVTLVLFFISFTIALLLSDRRKRGAFNMACFRSNQGYIGIPIIWGFFSFEAVSKTAVINGVDSLTVIFLSVIALEIFSMERYTEEESFIGKPARIARRMFFNFITNPFIISSIAALVLAFVVYKLNIANPWLATGENKLNFPFSLFDKTLALAEGTALPLSLVLVGSSLDLHHIRKNLKIVSVVSFIKLLIAPIISFLIAVFGFGLSGENLGIVVILAATPTAVSSYIMSKEMGSDDSLSAAAIGFTTFASVVTISVVRILLKVFYQV